MLTDVQPDDAAREQVNRLLRSQTFRQSETLRRLLAYLAEKSLSGESAHLKEYSVGVDVFGKAPDYDPQRDASVRIQAGKLRQKLEEYYRTEGLSDAILIDFPKGHFELRFTKRDPRPALTPAAVRFWKRAALTLAAVWVVTAILLLWSWAGRAAPLTPAQRAIWGPLLAGDRPVLVCLGTPLFIRDSRGFFRSPLINRWEEAAQLQGADWPKPQILAGQAKPAHIYTGVGDAMAAIEVARLLSAADVPFVVRRSSALPWEELAHNHIVFLGPPKFTPRINEIPIQLDFVMQGNQILNLRPRPGEPKVLQGSWPEDSPNVVEDYAIISRVPGLHGRSRYLILSASSTEGTAAAALFVTDPVFAAELIRRAADPAGRLPEFFQAIIHARFRAMVPVEITWKFHHELQRNPQVNASSTPSPQAKD